jgi:hypothetical protein
MTSSKPGYRKPGVLLRPLTPSISKLGDNPEYDPTENRNISLMPNPEYDPEELREVHGIFPILITTRWPSPLPENQ